MDMTVTIDLDPDVEARLRDEAARQGVDFNTFLNTRVLGAVGGVVQRSDRDPLNSQSLPTAEADLLQRINAGPGEEVWRRYHALVAKRRAETLSAAEHAELIDLSDRIEEANAQRIGHLVELARLRGVSLPAVMTELGITAPAPLDPPDNG
jgi:hypothetical protein